MRAPHASQLGPNDAGHRALPTSPSSLWQILHLLSETQPENASLHFAARKRLLFTDSENLIASTIASARKMNLSAL
jgi:hypothetical protein